MTKYFHSIQVVCLALFFTSCGQPQKAKCTLSAPNIAMHVNIIPDAQTTEVFQGLVKTCKQYGSVQIVNSDELYKENDPRVFVAVSVSRLHEGFIPNFGKSLPVFEVQLWAKDFDGNNEFSSSTQAEEYIGVSTNQAENTQKMISSFEHLLSTFDERYKSNHPKAQSPVFYIEKPSIESCQSLE